MVENYCCDHQELRNIVDIFYGYKLPEQRVSLPPSPEVPEAIPVEEAEPEEPIMRECDLDHGNFNPSITYERCDDAGYCRSGYDFFGGKCDVCSVLLVGEGTTDAEKNVFKPTVSTPLMVCNNWTCVDIHCLKCVCWNCYQDRMQKALSENLGTQTRQTRYSSPVNRTE